MSFRERETTEGETTLLLPATVGTRAPPLTIPRFGPRYGAPRGVAPKGGGVPGGVRAHYMVARGVGEGGARREICGRDCSETSREICDGDLERSEEKPAERFVQRSVQTTGEILSALSGMGRALDGSGIDM